MSKVFVSYSRKNREAVRTLVAMLEGRGLDVWIDWSDIPPAAPWEPEIYAAIEEAHAFMFLISPASIDSTRCKDELDHALHCSKRLIPVLIETVNSRLAQSEVASLQWIYLRTGIDDLEKGLGQIQAAVETDLQWVESHTWLLQRARKWEQMEKNAGFLHGRELREAEQWLARAAGKQPPPGPLHSEYIVASGRAAASRQKRVLAAVVMTLAVTVVLAFAVFAQSQQVQVESHARMTREAEALSARETAESEARLRATREVEAIEARDAAKRQAEARATAQAEAENQATVSRSRELASAANANIDIDPERSLLLAIEAAQLARNPETEDALRRALYSSQVRNTLRVEPQSEQYRGGGGTTSGADMANFSPDGKLLVSVDHNRYARIWTVPDGVLVANLTGHKGNIVAALFSPTGEQVATASRDGTALLWDATTGSLVAVLKGHESGITAAAFSLDGQWLVTASEDGTTTVWQVSTGALQCVLKGHRKEVLSVMFSPDGLQLVTSSADWTARLWDVASCREIGVLEKHMDAVTKVVFSPNGQWIATASADMTAALWDSHSGALRQTLTEHFGSVNNVAFSPDSKRLVTTGGDSTARVWEVSTGRQTAVLLGHDPIVTSAEFSADGWRIVTCSTDGTARLWDTITGQQLSVLRGHTARVNSAKFSPDGAWVVTASEDGTVRIWSSDLYELSVFPGYMGLAGAIAISPNDRWLAAVESNRFDTSGQRVSEQLGKAWIWDLASGALVRTLQGYESEVTALGFSSDSGWLVTLHGEPTTVRVWDVVQGREIMEFVASEDRISDFAFTPDQRLFITAGAEGVEAWNTANRWQQTSLFNGAEPDHVTLALSPAGRWLAGIWHGSGVFRIWDFASATEISVPHGTIPRRSFVAGGGVRFSPDAQWLTALYLTDNEDGGSGGLLEVWNTADWSIVYQYLAHNPIDQVFFSPDHQLLVFSDEQNAVKVVRLGPFHDIAVLQGHTDDLTDVDFDQDLARIATSSYDYTARIWDLASGTVLAVIQDHEDTVSDVAFSPDGHRVATASHDGTARIWEASTGQAIAYLRGFDEPVSDVWFSQDGSTILVRGSSEIRAYAATIDGLMELARKRTTRDLTCQERVGFLHESLECPPGG